MVKHNFGDILSKNQLSIRKVLIVLILALPFIGAIIDNMITDSINGDSITSQSDFNLFVFIGLGLTIFIIFKKRSFAKNMIKMSKVKSALRQVLLSNSQLYLDKGDDIKVGPLVKIQEDDTDLFLTLRLPFGLSKDNFKKSKDLFENALGYSVLKINETQSDLVFHFRKAQKELSTDYLYQGTGSVILGFDSYGNPIYWDALKEPHLIVAAGTGGGKTVYLQSIVLQLRKVTKNLIFVDFKGNEFGPLDTQYKVHTDLEGVVDTLRAFNQGMKVRAKQLKENRLRDYTELGLEPHYLIVDEYSELISMFPNTKEGKAEKAEFETLLGSIARLGRSAGYYVILSMQQPNANTLTTEIRDNMMKKVAIKGANNTVQTMIYGERVSDIDTNLDYGNHIINTGNGYEVITVPYYQGDFFGDMGA